MTPSVLLPTGYSRTEYVVLRSLAKRGVTVHVADPARAGMAQWSRLRASVHRRVPDAAPAAELVTDVVRIARAVNAGVILPTDALTMVLAEHAALVPNDIALPLADAASMRLANDKARLTAFAAGLGLSVPRSYAYDDPQTIAVSAPADAKLVVKLLDSSGSHGVFMTNGAAAAAELCTRLIAERGLARDAYPLVQDYVTGEGWGVSALYWNGSPIADFTHRRLREKSAGGTSTLRASARATVIEDAARRLLGSLSWHGLAMVEFRYDASADRYWILEVNPRVWGSIALPVGCGVDFPWWLYLCATGRVDEAKSLAARPYPVGRVARWILGDAAQLARAVVRGQVGDAARIAFGQRADIWDDFALDDPIAFVGECVSYITRSIA